MGFPVVLDDRNWPSDRVCDCRARIAKDRAEAYCNGLWCHHGRVMCYLWKVALVNDLQIAGVALQYVAMRNQKGVLLAGKMINGAAVGGLLSVGSAYASEV